MTESERKDYKKLTSAGKDYYDMAKRNHPDWSHNQVMTFVAITINLQPPRNKIETLRDLLLATIEKAKEFLNFNFPDLYKQVIDSFDSIVLSIQNTANVAVETIQKLISKFK